MAGGRPPKGGGTEVNLVRTRARNPKAKAQAAAAATIATTLQAQAAASGAKVFTLYGEPPEQSAAAAQPSDERTPTSLAFYRSLMEA
jgi:hypothetical protein